LRLKPFESSSRFGIRLESFEDYQEVAKVVRKLLPADVGFAVHQHHQSSSNGHDVWLSQTRAFLQQAKLLEELCEKPIRIIDIGGGWTHESFIPFAGNALEQLTDEICQTFPKADEIIIEPGKAICEQSQFLVSRVLEKRGKDFVYEVVSDACLAELPLAVDFGRSVYHVNKSGDIAKLTTGVGRILGRICMEHDILANGILLPKKIEEDDLLIFSHAGAYESSMSYKFGNGESHESQN
jgi:diaminopimelate decarboxylase